MGLPSPLARGPLRAKIGVLALGLALGACAAPPADFVAAERTCYRTLARVDCHAQPLPGESSRQVGYFDWQSLETEAKLRRN